MYELMEEFLFNGNILALLACLFLAPKTFLFFIVFFGVVAWTFLTLPSDANIWVNQSLGWVTRCSWYRSLEALISDLTADVQRKLRLFLVDTRRDSCVHRPRRVRARVASRTRSDLATAAQPAMNARVEVIPSGTNPHDHSQTSGSGHMERQPVPGRGVLPEDLLQMRDLERRIQDLRHTMSWQLREHDTSFLRSRQGPQASSSGNRHNVAPSRSTTGSAELSDMGLESALPATSLAQSSPYHDTQATDTSSSLELMGTLRSSASRSTLPGPSRTTSRSTPDGPRNSILHTTGSVPQVSARIHVDFSDSTRFFSPGLVNTGWVPQSHSSLRMSESYVSAATHAGPDPPSTGDSRALIDSQSTFSRPRPDIGRESATARRRIYGQRVVRLFASSFRNNRRAGLTTGLAHSGSNWSTLGSVVPRTNRSSTNSRSVPYTRMEMENRQRRRPLSAAASTMGWTDWLVTPFRPSRGYFWRHNEPNPDASPGPGTAHSQSRRNHSGAANAIQGRSERNHSDPTETLYRRASPSNNGADPPNIGFRFTVPARMSNGRPWTNSNRLTNVLSREMQHVNLSTPRANGAPSHDIGDPSLTNGASSMANIISSLTNGASSLANTVSSLVNGASSVATGASSLANAASTLANRAASQRNRRSLQTNTGNSRLNIASGRMGRRALFQRESLGSHSTTDQSVSSVSLSPVISSDVEHFRSAMEAERDKRKCVVCKDKRKSVLVMPCKHLCMCSSCGKRISQAEDRSQRVCPLCRADIYTTFRVYV